MPASLRVILSTMSTQNILPASKPLGGALAALMVFAIGLVPACSGGSETPQENANVKPMETVQDSLPPIDAAAPKVTATATFASG